MEYFLKRRKVINLEEKFPKSNPYKEIETYFLEAEKKIDELATGIFVEMTVNIEENNGNDITSIIQK